MIGYCGGTECNDCNIHDGGYLAENAIGSRIWSIILGWFDRQLILWDTTTQFMVCMSGRRAKNCRWAWVFTDISEMTNATKSFL